MSRQTTTPAKMERTVYFVPVKFIGDVIHSGGNVG